MVVPVRRKQIPDISPRPPLRRRKTINDNSSLSDNMVSFSKLPSVKRKAEEKLRLIELEKEKVLQDKRRRRSKGIDSEDNEFKFPSPAKTKDERKVKDKKVTSNLVKLTTNTSVKQFTDSKHRLSTDEEEICFSSPSLSSGEQPPNRHQLGVIKESRASNSDEICEARKPLSTKNNDASGRLPISSCRKQTANYLTTVGSIDYSAILQRHKMSTRTGDSLGTEDGTPATDDETNSNVNSYVTTSEGMGYSAVGSTVSQISLPVSQNKKSVEYVDMNGSKTISAAPNKKKSKPLKDYNHEKSLTFVNLVHSTPAHSNKRRHLRKEAATIGIIGDKIDEDCTFIGLKKSAIATEPSPPMLIDSAHCDQSAAKVRLKTSEFRNGHSTTLNVERSRNRCGKSVITENRMDDGPILQEVSSRLTRKPRIQKEQSQHVVPETEIVEKALSKREKSANTENRRQTIDDRILQEPPSDPSSDIQDVQVSSVAVPELDFVEKSRTKSSMAANPTAEAVRQSSQKTSDRNDRHSGLRSKRMSSLVISELNVAEKSEHVSEKTAAQEIPPQKSPISSNHRCRKSIIQVTQTISAPELNGKDKSQRIGGKSAITRNRLHDDVEPVLQQLSLFTDSVTSDATYEQVRTLTVAGSPLNLTDSSDEDDSEETTIYVGRPKETPERIFLPTPKLVIPNSADFTPGCRRSRRRRVDAMPGGAKLIYKFTDNGQKELVGADKVEVTEQGFYKKYGQYFKPTTRELRSKGLAKMPKTDFVLAVRRAEKRAQKMKNDTEDSINNESMMWLNEAGALSRMADKFKISYVDLDRKTSGFVKLRPGYTITGNNDVNVKYLVIYGVIEVTHNGNTSVKSPHSGYFVIDGKIAAILEIVTSLFGIMFALPALVMYSAAFPVIFNVGHHRNCRMH